MACEKSIAIAFGGGGARGFAHIHVINTLNELGLKPAAISGTSIGAIMGSAMAAGMTGVEIEDYVSEVIKKPTNFASRLWKSRNKDWSSIFADGFRLGQFNIERIIDAFLPEQIPQNFDQLDIPLQLIATDFYGHCEAVMNDGDLRNAIAASAAIPAVFKPVKRDGRILIDGGIYNALPFDHLKGKADIIIAVDVTGYPTGDESELPGTTDAAYGASQLMQQAAISLRVKSAPPDIFLLPDIHSYRVLDFLAADKIMKSSEGIKDDLKRQLDKHLSA